jgi:hypothetical protein
MSGRGILNVVKVFNDAIKHMRKDFIPIYGDSHASTSIRDLSTGILILGLSPRIEEQLSNNEPMIESAVSRRLGPSRNSRPASSSAITTDRRSRTSISRMSRERSAAKLSKKKAPAI